MVGRLLRMNSLIVALIRKGISLPPPTLWDLCGLRVPILLVGSAVEAPDHMTRWFADGFVIASMFHQFCLRVEVHANLDLIHIFVVTCEVLLQIGQSW